MIAGGAIAAGLGPLSRSMAQSPEITEVDLTDEPSRGQYGTYDLNRFGPTQFRDMEPHFQFPNSAEVELAYGIDISHYTTEVPWAELRKSKVNYVYIKASQSRNGRDKKFAQFWHDAASSDVPFGAYHFLTAGPSGAEQGAYFMKRVKDAGGLRKGHLQPVIDLEWDTFGPDFKRVVVGKTKKGEPIYKDYWDDKSLDIVKIVNECAETIRKANPELNLRPIIYTAQEWWKHHIPTNTVFPKCDVWIADYWPNTFAARTPRTVPLHKYHLWQFTDKGSIKIGDKVYGPYDTNRLVFGGIEKVLIS